MLWGIAALSALAAVPGSVRLEYDAPTECPSREVFWESVRARAPTAELTDEEARTYRVRLVQQEDRVDGTLEIVDRDDSYPPRKISGRACDEVASALALVVALALRAQPSSAAQADVPKADEPPPPEPPPLEPPLSVPPTPAGVTATVEPEAAPWRWSVGADVAAVLGVIPGVELGVPVFVDLHGSSASFRAGFIHAVGGAGAGTGVADFSWTVGRLEGCPARLAIDDFVAEPCLRLDVGRITGAAERVEDPARETLLWVAVGVVGRVRWVEPRPLFLELEVGASVPMRRHRFFLAPSETVHQVAVIAAQGGLGIGYTFW